MTIKAQFKNIVISGIVFGFASSAYAAQAICTSVSYPLNHHGYVQAGQIAAQAISACRSLGHSLGGVYEINGQFMYREVCAGTNYQTTLELTCGCGGTEDYQTVVNMIENLRHKCLTNDLLPGTRGIGSGGIGGGYSGGFATGGGSTPSEPGTPSIGSKRRGE